jgi:hypothetical protein
MGIRRSVYVAAGGLERARFRIAEDLALFRMGRDAGGAVNAWADPETTVVMDEVPSFTHLLSQLRRWVGGPLEQGPAYRVGVPLALAWGMVATAFLVAGWMRWPTPWAWSVGAKLVADLLLLHHLAARLPPTPIRFDIVRLWIVQVGAMAWLPLSFLVSRRLQWRGAGYTVRYQ